VIDDRLTLQVLAGPRGERSRVLRYLRPDAPVAVTLAPGTEVADAVLVLRAIADELWKDRELFPVGGALMDGRRRLEKGR